MQRSAIRFATARATPLALLVALSGCDRDPVFVPPAPPKVTVATPLSQPVQDEASFTGQTAAVVSVDLVARVPGFLQEAKVMDGADVQQGQVLYVIEPGQYEAQVDLAQATIEQHQALLKSAEAEFERQQTLQSAGGLDRRELRQGPGRPGFPAGGRRRGAGEPEAGADQSRLHQRGGSLRRPHRPPPGRSRPARRRRQRDQDRHPLRRSTRSTSTSRSTSATSRACSRPCRTAA